MTAFFQKSPCVARRSPRWTRRNKGVLYGLVFMRRRCARIPHAQEISPPKPQQRQAGKRERRGEDYELQWLAEVTQRQQGAAPTSLGGGAHMPADLAGRAATPRRRSTHLPARRSSSRGGARCPHGSPGPMAGDAGSRRRRPARTSRPDREGRCHMDLPGPTTSVGTRTDYSVGPWDYPACATRHLKAWSTRTTQE
jgi:hypothetical protein